jgi:hypothetical protein
MNLFRQMLNEARFFLHDERSLRGYLIEDIEKKKLKAEELLNVWVYEQVFLAKFFKLPITFMANLLIYLVMCRFFYSRNNLEI